MEQDPVISEENTFKITGIDTLAKFLRFKPDNPKVFRNGLELACDLKTESGTSLFKKGVKVSADRVARLRQLKEMKPEFEPVIKIKWDEKLLSYLRLEIKDRIAESIEKWRGNKVFRKLLSGTGKAMDGLMDEMLTDEDITLTIYRMWEACESSRAKKAAVFVDHSINVAVFSLALASSARFNSVIEMDIAKSVELVKAGLFHNYGALGKIDSVLKTPSGRRFKKYWNSNRDGYSAGAGHKLSGDILDALNLLGAYYNGEKEFIKRTDWQAVMAGILLVIETFISKINGLFGEPEPVRQTVDGLSLRAFENDLNDAVVSALTLALKLKDIFDFYYEMDCLISECANRAAYPYPMLGYRSPTIFICRKNVLECSHLDQNVKTVNLVRPVGELRYGEYHRCLLLTPRLQVFYNEHYKEIKESAGGEASA
ncbi:MAG: hypothetical protein U9N45_05550 [Gemmatimonadota bacterium]|nr:hypothetical protein [Gemmatimonadota bacterium]